MPWPSQYGDPRMIAGYRLIGRLSAGGMRSRRAPPPRSRQPDPGTNRKRPASAARTRTNPSSALENRTTTHPRRGADARARRRRTRPFLGMTPQVPHSVLPGLSNRGRANAAVALSDSAETADGPCFIQPQ